MGLLSTAFFGEGRLFEELSAAVDDVGAGGEGGEGGGAIEGYGAVQIVDDVALGAGICDGVSVAGRGELCGAEVVGMVKGKEESRMRHHAGSRRVVRLHRVV